MLLNLLAIVSISAHPVTNGSDHFKEAAAATIALAAATRAPASASPALAVVLVRKGEMPVIYVDGVADVRTRTSVTVDTPFYIASMTKAYVGLMAEALDRDGVFDIDQSLSDVWPELTLPDRDPGSISFRQLLSHQAPFRAEALSTLTAYVDEVPVAHYPRMLAESKPREPGFEYQNTGYLIYGAALEARTGVHWRRWLERTVLEPLDLEHTSTRMSFPGVAATHHWIGDGVWDTTLLKTDPLMHAAGGLVTSSADIGRWLQAQLGDATSAAVAPPEVWAAAQRREAAHRGKSAGMDCTGYALGWHTCDLAGEPVLVHGGGYSGARSWMAMAPGLGVAVAVMANSDSMTGDLGERLVRAFLSMAADPRAPAPDPGAFGMSYAALLASQLESRERRLAEAREESRWGDWTWSPEPAELAAYAGRYRGELGEMVIARSDAGLTAVLGQLRRQLTPATPDLFAAQADRFGSLEEMAFMRKGGHLTGVEWGGDLYERVESSVGADQ